MKQNSTLDEKPSRRAFTKSVLTTLASAPLAASLMSCSNQGGSQNQPAATSSTPVSTPASSPSSAAASPTPRTTMTGGCTITSCDFALQTEDHIPPMDLEGGGSIHLDSLNKLKKTGRGPFNYVEDGVDDEDRFGDLIKARIITELDDKPWVTDVLYSGFQPGTQLLLWYQDISPDPGDDDDTTFPPVTFPDNDPTLRIRGGKGADKFNMMIKKKSLSIQKSHKRHRPHRYRHGGGSGLAREFRIGQWRFVDKDGNTLCGHAGAENYRFFLYFGDFQP